MRRSSRPSGCVTRVQRATFLPFAQRSRVAEFDGMPGPGRTQIDRPDARQHLPSRPTAVVG